MQGYKHILLAVDLHSDGDMTIAEKAVELAKEYHCKLSVVHAVEHINAYGIAQAYPTVLGLETEMVSQAEVELKKLAEKFNLKQAELFVETGSPKIVILDVAARIGADLIVLGSHGRHGISLMLGSTANAVLHNAKSDVLAVRIKD